MSQQYSVIFVNNSTNSGSACMYQTDPDLGVPDVMSLAWFSKYAYEGTRVVFNWKTDYSFVWSETGELIPGVVFIASQTVETNLQTKNQITLNYDRAYRFTNQKDGSKEGSLFIRQDPSIPLKQASVGIGMQGKGTFVRQAQPNMNLTFTPKPKYWITFGNFEEGTVLDVGEVNNPAEIVFPYGVFSMTATLGEDNAWNIRPTRQANKALLAAKASNKQAKFGLV